MKKLILPLVAFVAAASLALTGCMPVSGLFGLGSPSGVPAVERAASSGQGVSLSTGALYDDGCVNGDLLYYTDTYYDSVNDSYGSGLYSLPLSGSGSRTLVIPAMGSYGTDYYIAPSSVTGGEAEIHLVNVSYPTAMQRSISIQRYSLAGVLLGTTSLEADTIALMDTVFKIRPGTDGYYIMPSATYQNRLIKLNAQFQLVWSVSLEDESLGYLLSVYYLTSMATAPNGDLFLSFTDRNGYTYETLADIAGGGVYDIDAATGAVKAVHAGKYAFSEPMYIAFDSQGTLFAYNYDRKSVQGYSSDFLPAFYAASSAWDLLGETAVIAILPSETSFKVVVSESYGVKVYTFTRP
jgi:hypothetical protein